MGKDNKFWCDRCYTIKLDENLEKTKQFFSCYRTEQMVKHLASKKHLKEMQREKTDDDILCKYCNQFFSKEGYAEHKKRNELLWTMAGIMKFKCNNFIYNNNRYSSWDKMKEVAICSKTTNENININKQQKVEQKIEKKKEVEKDYYSDDSYVEEFVFYDYCYDCGKPINNCGYKKDDLENRGHKVCDCYNENDYDTDELLNNNNQLIKTI